MGCGASTLRYKPMEALESAAASAVLNFVMADVDEAFADREKLGRELSAANEAELDRQHTDLHRVHYPHRAPSLGRLSVRVCGGTTGSTTPSNPTPSWRA